MLKLFKSCLAQACMLLQLILISSQTVEASPKISKKQLVYTGYQQGISWEVFLLNKRFAGSINDFGDIGKLYLVDLETIQGKSKRLSTNLVQCSTRFPFVAGKDFYNSKLTIVTFINPGGDFVGYNRGDNWLYWLICHGVVEARVDSLDELKAKAQHLGYTLDLKNRQESIPYWDYEKLKP